MNTRFLLALFLAAAPFAKAAGNTLRVAVVQSFDEGLEANRAKIVRFIRQAGEAGCHLALFNENALLENAPAVLARPPAKAELDRALDQIRAAAKASGVAVVLGTAYKNADAEPLRNRAFVFGPDGGLLMAYWKNIEVPRVFDIHGVRCAVTICSDRGYLEHSDLVCVTQGAQVIVDISGGHGGDDGRPDLRWIRYRPWAIRNEAYLIVSNPVHDETDFMGNSPYGGGSAVIRPDGSLQASRIYEKDVMIVANLDLTVATRREAERRRQHPLFKEFWDRGEQLLNGEPIAPAPNVVPYQSKARDIKIAAAQIGAPANLEEATSKVLHTIGRAAGEKADIVVFPALTLTGDRADAVLGAAQAAMASALNVIQRQARAAGIFVIIGLPYFIDGARQNCAFVIGDDGEVKTRYAEIAGREGTLFRGGDATKTM